MYGGRVEIVQGGSILDTPDPGACVHESRGGEGQGVLAPVGMSGKVKEATKTDPES